MIGTQFTVDHVVFYIKYDTKYLSDCLDTICQCVLGLNLNRILKSRIVLLHSTRQQSHFAKDLLYCNVELFFFIKGIIVPMHGVAVTIVEAGYIHCIQGTG